MIDRRGFRAGIGIILANAKNQLFLGRRIQQNAWQFPQGGLLKGEAPFEGMLRELYEEIGLKEQDVEMLAASKNWLKYRLPANMIRYNSRPLCLGQRQKWFLLRLVSKGVNFSFDVTDKPEFDGFRWVSYWYPLQCVIPFKKRVYRRALQEFAGELFIN